MLPNMEYAAQMSGSGPSRNTRSLEIIRAVFLLQRCVLTLRASRIAGRHLLITAASRLIVIHASCTEVLALMLDSQGKHGKAEEINRRTLEPGRGCWEGASVNANEHLLPFSPIKELEAIRQLVYSRLEVPY
jgi:hypothetical protein